MDLKNAINAVKKEYSEYYIRKCINYKNSFVFMIEPKGFRSTDNNYILDPFVIVNNDGSVKTFSPIEDLETFMKSKIIDIS